MSQFFYLIKNVNMYFLKTFWKTKVKCINKNVRFEKIIISITKCMVWHNFFIYLNLKKFSFKSFWKRKIQTYIKQITFKNYDYNI